ncbi:MAG: hypothetical protein NW220_12490 [Leptolyngbyaceae cyanobacterium bins.349]|nr:hypothetical protein [Leptolyngbyaceae cyanobacterium bins.349]
MQKVIGILFLLAGIYFLGQNIVFSTYYAPFFWRNLPAMGSVLAIVSGIVSLIWFPRQTGSLGWILIIVGILLVFLSGGVLLKPTSLWSFFISFTAIAAGSKLLLTRRFRF